MTTPNPSAGIKREAGICIFFLIAFIFFATYNDWIYDESTSYVSIPGNSIADLITYSKFKLANNHIINSLYFRWLQQAHITNVLYYRIPGMVGFLLFFIANVWIFRLLNINSLYIILLTIAPYFLFFSYGRGYAIALGSYAMSLYYLLKYTKDQQVRYEYLIVFFGAVSSLSIFSFLYGFLSILIVFGIFKIKHLKNIHTFLLSFIVLAVIFYIYKAGKIVNANDPAIIGVDTLSPLKYGTISSIFSDFSYRESIVTLFFNNARILRLITYYKYFIMLCVIVPLFYTRKVNLRKTDLADTRTILYLLVFLPFVFMVAAHTFTHALYPLKRAVFYLHYLLLLLILVSTITYSRKVIFYIPLIVLCLTSLMYSIYTYYDLSLPTYQEALRATKNHPLYVLFENDKSLSLTNNLSGINKQNITERHSTPDIIPLVQKDSSDIRYIICWPAYKDSCLACFNNTRVYNYRNGTSLIEILR